MAQQRNSITIKIQALVDGLSSIRKLSDEIEAMGGDTSEAAAEIAKLEKELDALNRQQGAVDRLQKINKELKTTENALEQAREEATRLGREFAQAEKPTKRLADQFERSRKRVRDLKAAYAGQAQALKAASNSAKAAGLDTKRLVAEQVKLAAASTTARQKVELLGNGLREVRNEMKAAAASGRRAGADISKSMASISASLRRVERIAATVFGASIIGGYVKDLADVADEYTQLTAKLDLVSEGQREFNLAQEETARIADETRSGITDVVNLYTRLRVVQKDQGVAIEDTISLTETLTKALKISGATQQEASATLTQLTQAFSSGVLRGQEFNSMMEQGPRIAKALADGLGVPVSALRAMAEAGEISAERLGDALLSQKDKIATEYEKLPLTIEGAVTQLSNAWVRYVGEADKASGASKSVADGIALIASNLDEIADVAVRVGEVLVAGFALKSAGALKSYVAAAIIARNETIALGAAAEGAAAKMTLLGKAGNLLIAAFTGWQIGTYLREEFAVVEKAGIAFTGAVHAGFRRMQGGWEAFKTVFSDDTVSDAMQRMRDDVAEIEANYQGLFNAVDERGKTSADGLNKVAGATDDVKTAADGAAVAIDNLAASQTSATQSASTLTAAQSSVASSYNSLIDGATSAEEVTLILADAMQALAGHTEAQGIVSEVAAQKITELAGAAEHAAAAAGIAAAKYLTLLQSAKTTADVTRILTDAMRDNALSIEAQGLVSESAAKRNQTLADVQKDVADKINNSAEAIKNAAASTKSAGDRQKVFNEVITDTSTVMDKMIAHLQFWQSEMDGISEAARRAFDGMVDAVNNAGGALVTSFDASAEAAQSNAAEIASLSAQIQHMRSAYDQATGDVNRWMIAVETAGLVVKRAYLQQDEAIRGLETRLENATTLTQEQADAAKQALASYTLLDKARLDSLRSQIDQIRQATEALNDSALATLTSLQNELDRMNGNLAAIEARNYELKRLQLLEQINAAQAAGDAAALAKLQQSLILLEKIHQIKMANLEADQKSNSISSSSTSTRTSSQFGRKTSGRADSSTTTSNITIEVPVNLDGKTVARIVEPYITEFGRLSQ